MGKNKIKKIIAVGFFCVAIFVVPVYASTDTDISAPAEIKKDAEAELDVLQGEIDTLKDQLKEKRETENVLDEELNKYNKEIEAKQREAVNLENQMTILDKQISQSQVSIVKVENDIDEKKLEIDRIVVERQSLEQQVAEKKEVVAEYLRELYREEDKDVIAALLLNDSLSAFFNKQHVLMKVQENIHTHVVDLLQLKEEAALQEEYAVQKKSSLEKLQDKLIIEKNSFQEQQSVQTILLEQTKEGEEKFQQLLAQAKAEQTALSSSISVLEQEARDKLESLAQAKGDKVGDEELLEILGDAVLSWPLTPDYRRITAYFHDPTYPFRNIFSHSAIDIAVPQGTPVFASADGVVGVARDVGWIETATKKYPAYNYILIAHNNEISTLYGHLSKVSVSVGEVVKKGQVIGSSGATPGTAGAGLLTTGPHLHFEVRSNGLPVDPLNYLP